MSLDSKALRKNLNVLAVSGNSKRDEVLAVLKSELDTQKHFICEGFEAGHLGGLECARMIAALHDEVIKALYDFTVTSIVQAPNPTQAERLALCAVGGYGRAEMAPYSDVDLLFLVADKKGSAFTENVTEYILYMLWDLGLKVGHAVRTPEQCMRLSRDDQTILTALLDLRLLRGDAALNAELSRRMAKETGKGKSRAYIAYKLEERDRRHTREGNSRYVIEPNVKEGKGGLRDLHVLYWIARFLDRDDKITDPQRAQDYVDLGLFDDQAATRFVRAADFLWRKRIHLHYSAGRAVEVLSFDKQVDLARKMGYAAGPVEEAVEKFMREYFTNAREVGALTRIACAKLEAENRLRLPKGLVRFLPSRSRGMKTPGFEIENGRLMFTDPLHIRENPALIMQLFEISGRRNLDIHPDALSAIDFRRNLIDNNFRSSPDIADIFKQILLGAEGPYATLKLMNEAGVLGRYLLEFGGIVARTQFNMHHAYTVDEHTLRLVDHYKDLEVGDLKEDHPLLTEIVQAFDASQRLSLYLACLLHDTGKGVGDQCVEGARLARRACRRLGLEQKEIERIAWLVRSHLDMSETAQRRDISDPDTVAEFASRVGSVRRLDMLYALTVVDIRAVGPGIWNDWKKVLLRDLYLAAKAYIEGNTTLEPLAKATAIQEQFNERLPGDLSKRITDITNALPANYWTGFTMTELVLHARFFDTVKDMKSTSIHIRVDKPRDITELWILTRDRPGLFADLTLGIAASGALITGARLNTGENGLVMNVFYLQNTERLAFGRQSLQALDILKTLTTRSANGETDNLTVPHVMVSRRAEAIPVHPQIRLIEVETSEATILEIEGRDRPGLLHQIAKCLHDNDMDVLSAHIENVGERVFDAFYIRARNGNGSVTPQQRQQLVIHLEQVLSSHMGDAQLLEQVG